MDFFTICGCLISLLVLFGILLYYVTRETSYEQALEEQKRKSDFDLLTAGTNSGASNAVGSVATKHESKKDKSKKSKDVNHSKKSKDKLLTNKTSATSLPTVPTLTPNNDSSTAAAVTPTASKIPKAINNNGKTVSITANETGKMAQTQPSSSSVPMVSVPNEPKKSETVKPPQQQQVVETKITAATNVNEVAHSFVPKSETDSGGGGDDTTVKPNPNSAKPSDLANNKFKKSKKSVTSKVSISKELNMDDIIESIKLLTKEDVTVLTDYLLNMQADHQINDLHWQKKNDPVESLKKQLDGKEEIIKSQKNNLESAKAKLESLQHELTIAKKALQHEAKIRKEIEHEKNKYYILSSSLEMKHKQQVQKMDEQNRLLEEEIAKLNNAIQELQNQNSVLQLQKNDREKLLEQLDEKNQLIQANKKSILEMKENFDKEKALLEANLQEKMQKNQAALKNLEEENSRINVKNEELLKEMEKLKREIATLNETMKRKENDLENNQTAMKKENEELRSKLQDLIKTNQSLAEEIEKFKKINVKQGDWLKLICSEFEIDLDEKEENVDRLIKSIEDLKSKAINHLEDNENLNAEHEKILEEYNTLKQQFEAKTGDCELYAKTLAETDNTLITIKASMEQILSKKAEIQEELNEKNQEIQSIREELLAKQKEIDSLSVEIVMIKEELVAKQISNDMVVQEKTKLNEKFEKINELLQKQEQQIDELKNQNDSINKMNEELKDENKNLRISNDKMNDMMQIGLHSYQDEKKKVLELETKLNSAMNGGGGGDDGDNNSNDNCSATISPASTSSTMPTTNGN